MPCPIDLYQGPASFLMSMPMLFQRLISAMCVPELSPREMKGAPLALMVFSAKATFLAPLMLAGSSFGPMMIKIVVHHGIALHAKPFRNEFLLCLPGMHENHVGIAAARGVECLAGTLGDDFNDDAGLGFEQRQDPAEQTGVLRRGGGGDQNGFVLRAGGCGGDERDGRCQNDQATADRHDVLLLVRVSRH